MDWQDSWTSLLEGAESVHKPELSFKLVSVRFEMMIVNHLTVQPQNQSVLILDRCH